MECFSFELSLKLVVAKFDRYSFICDDASEQKEFPLVCTERKIHLFFTSSFLMPRVSHNY